MARTAKTENHLQVFLGSRNRPDVFVRNASGICCDQVDVSFDKLAERTRFDNALSHLNPLGANDKFRAPYGNGFDAYRKNIVDHINSHGVGAKIGVIAIPTYAFVTGVGVHVAAEETGLSFNLITRNGLVLPTAKTLVVDATDTGDCEVTRTSTAGDASSFEGFGALDPTALFQDILGFDGSGQFALEADELILEVASLPPSGEIVGDFDITVSVNYQIVHRAEA